MPRAAVLVGAVPVRRCRRRRAAAAGKEVALQHHPGQRERRGAAHPAFRAGRGAPERGEAGRPRSSRVALYAGDSGRLRVRRQSAQRARGRTGRRHHPFIRQKALPGGENRRRRYRSRRGRGRQEPLRLSRGCEHARLCRGRAALHRAHRPALRRHFPRCVRRRQRPVLIGDP